jgi:transcriptional regulator with XRE-family HTH domain
MGGKRRAPIPHLAEQDPIDQHIALRLRQLRYQRKFTQKQLGDALGITFQQVQKYELGSNRISGAALYRVSKVLGVPFSAFFAGFEDHAPLPPAVDQNAEILAAAVSRIANPAVRDTLLDLIAALIGYERRDR